MARERSCDITPNSAQNYHHRPCKSVTPPPATSAPKIRDMTAGRLDTATNRSARRPRRLFVFNGAAFLLGLYAACSFSSPWIAVEYMPAIIATMSASGIPATPNVPENSTSQRLSPRPCTRLLEGYLLVAPYLKSSRNPHCKPASKQPPSASLVASPKQLGSRPKRSQV